MPVYDYECGHCAHKFEERKSFSEGAIATCPQCRKEAKRIFVPVPIVFKGSGFYVTDYRKEKAPVEEKPSSHKTVSPSAAPSKTESSVCKN